MWTVSPRLSRSTGTRGERRPPEDCLTSHLRCHGDKGVVGSRRTPKSIRSTPEPSKRATAIDSVRAEMTDLLADPEREFGEVLEEATRLGVRLVI